MADVAALTGSPDYNRAIDRIWDNVVSSKLYITGGIGATGSGEAFGEPYYLPNATAYAETCAAIGNAFWNFRMFLLHGDAQYIDVLERIMYNGLISGVALSGDLFFYPNPLESFGQHKRSPWFTCACCPSNISRFMPSVPGYVYAQRDDTIYVNLFIDSKVNLDIQGHKITLSQETKYPWKGAVKINLDSEIPVDFSLNVRIPGWAQNQPVPSRLYSYLQSSEEDVALKVNGEKIPLNMEKGYAVVRRVWEKDDTIELDLPLTIRRVVSAQEVEANAGRVALQRGPVVYCAEWEDNNGQVSNLVLDDSVALAAEYRSDLFDGVTVINGEVLALYQKEDGTTIDRKSQTFTAIPYYAWAHRGQGEMAVWLPREESLARPLPQPTLASQSKASASGGKDASSLNDQREPKNSIDRSFPYLHWWPRKGTVEWVQYDFPSEQVVSLVEVYWFDDTGRGECRVPQSWRVLYKKNDTWKPVVLEEPYGVEKDRYNRVKFTPVRTKALRLEITLQKEFSAGIHEWKVK